jgi:hypothetical protein
MRTLRARLALFVSILGACTAASVAGASPANAASPAVAGDCPSYIVWSGDRACYFEPGDDSVLWTVTHVFAGSDGHDRAAGQSFGPSGSTIYFDISRDGGKTWAGWQDAATQDETVGYWYTQDATYDGPGYWVRTCATSGYGDYVCTPWH